MLEKPECCRGDVWKPTSPVGRPFIRTTEPPRGEGGDRRTNKQKNDSSCQVRPPGRPGLLDLDDEVRRAWRRGCRRHTLDRGEAHSATLARDPHRASHLTSKWSRTAASSEATDVRLFSRKRSCRPYPLSASAARPHLSLPGLRSRMLLVDTGRSDVGSLTTSLWVSMNRAKVTGIEGGSLERSGASSACPISRYAGSAPPDRVRKAVGDRPGGVGQPSRAPSRRRYPVRIDSHLAAPYGRSGTGEIAYRPTGDDDRHLSEQSHEGQPPQQPTARPTAQPHVTSRGTIHAGDSAPYPKLPEPPPVLEDRAIPPAR